MLPRILKQPSRSGDRGLALHPEERGVQPQEQERRNPTSGFKHLQTDAR